MRCPGQDPRYWTENIVFEVPCPRCGSLVELFRDETAVRCPKCRHRFRNPKLDLSCAQWCEHAEQCLGVSLPADVQAHLGEGRLASCLIQQLRDFHHDDTQQFTLALVAFQHALHLVAEAGGDPGVVFAVTLFWQVAVGPWPQQSLGGGGSQSDAPAEMISQRAERLKRMFAEACLPGGIAEQATETLLAAATGTPLTLEGQIASDAWRLAEWGKQFLVSDSQPSEQQLDLLRTEAARRRARQLFFSKEPDSQ